MTETAFKLSPDTAHRLEVIQQRLGAKSAGEALDKAVALAEIVVETSAGTGRVQIVGNDGVKTAVKLKP